MNCNYLNFNNDCAVTASGPSEVGCSKSGCSQRFCLPCRSAAEMAACSGAHMRAVTHDVSYRDGGLEFGDGLMVAAAAPERFMNFNRLNMNNACAVTAQSWCAGFVPETTVIGPGGQGIHAYTHTHTNTHKRARA